MKKIYEELINNIPDYKEFLTVEELDNISKKLAADYPDVVDIFEIGKTRGNHPLYCLKIGNGSNNGLMFGCPHPNEPIGTMMLEYFTEELAKNKEFRESLDYTWYIIKAWDADGTKLNEKWFKGPYNLYNYARNFFRPAGHQQVDWTFPIDYKKLHFNNSIPETKAMMNLIDSIKPKFIYSLHNAGFGGTYWYVTHDINDVYDEMRSIALKQEIPLNLGEPEAPYCKLLSPAIYKNLGIHEEYDYLESYGIENPEELIKVGTCSAEYGLDCCDAFTLLTELPYFYDKRIEDLSDSDMTRKDAIIEKLDFNSECNGFIKNIMERTEKYIDENNPFKIALDAFTVSKSDEATRRMINEKSEFSKLATVAEKFDNLLVSKFYKTLSYGLLVRMNETELEKLDDKDSVKYKELKSAYDESEKALIDLSSEIEEKINYEVVPIKKLVAIQLGCGLVVAEHIRDKGSVN